MFGHAECRSNNKLVQREKDRMQNDEKKIDRCAEFERCRIAVQKAEFQEANKTSYSRALTRLQLGCQQKANTGHIAFIMVRREALCRLLQQERQLYANELSQRGLAFHQLEL